MKYIFTAFFVTFALLLPIVPANPRHDIARHLYDELVYAAPQKGGNAGTVGNSLYNGLQAYWTLDQTSGSRPAAFQVQSLTLSDNNTVGSTTGKIGNAASFVGSSSEYLSLSDDAAVSIGDIDCTIAFWFRITSTATQQAIISKWRADGSSNCDYLINYDGGLIFAVTSDGDAFATYKDVVSSVSISNNTWYFVVCQHDAAADQISINVNGTTTTGSHNGGVYDGLLPLEVGILEGVSPLTGDVDALAIWKRKLTAAEITYLYNSGNGRPPIP